ASEMQSAPGPQGTLPARFPLGPGPVYWRQWSEFLVVAAEDGSLLLPKVILWAFRLNEGDLLTVSREEGEGFRCRFRSYGAAVWTITDGIGCSWPFLEKLLRLPMAVVGPQGALLLPEEAALLASTPRVSLLRVPPRPGDGFTLEPVDERRMVSPRPCLEALYTLPVESGSQIRLPQDVLWVLGLGEGDRLACKTSLGTADFEPWAKLETLKGRTVVELGPGGTLSLPQSLLRDLQPGWRIRLTVSFDPEPDFRLTYAVS